jgi:hypothetical protein
MIIKTLHKIYCVQMKKVKQSHLQTWSGPEGSRKLRFSDFMTTIAYGLEGPGIEFWWGRVFLHLSRPALRPTQTPVQWVPGFFRG